MNNTNKIEIHDLDITTLLDVISKLNVMILLADRDLVIEDATPSFVAYLDHPLVGASLIEVAPDLAGIEGELVSIASEEVEPWRIPGIQLSQTDLRPCDLLFMPNRATGGLIVAARLMDGEIIVEQALRQQRNELALLQEQYEAQASILRTTHDRLENVDRERSALLTLLARDIKSSLSVVAGYTEWLAQELKPIANSEHRAALEAMTESVKRMTNLMSGVQAVEQIEGKLADISWDLTDLVEMVTEVATMWRGVASVRGVSLEVEAEGGGLVVEGDRELLQQALQVLVECAVQQADRNTSVVLRLSSWDRWAIIRIDHRTPTRSKWGQKAKKRSRQTRIEPSGMELALVRMIAEGHGGHLSFEEGQQDSCAVSIWLLRRQEKSTPSSLQLTGLESGEIEDADAYAVTLPSPSSDLIVVGEGTIRINPRSKRVWVNTDPVALSDSEYRLLLYLAENAGQVIGHDEIVEAIWSEDEPESLDNLRVLVWRLRQKIERGSKSSQYLRTVRGFGYILVS